MTKDEYLALLQSAATSGRTLKSILQEKGIASSTYNYWRRKYVNESSALPMAPITVMRTAYQGKDEVTRIAGPAGMPDMSEVLGVTLAFPNGLRAHFGRGSESLLMEVLNRSLPLHVQPE